MYRYALALVLLPSLGACANFGATSEFALQTTRMTGLVRAEFAELDTLCTAQAELSIVLGDIADEGPLKSCQAFRSSQARLAAVTLDVLDDYSNVLTALADESAFELRIEPTAFQAQAAGVQDADGRALASAGQVTALGRLIEVLAQIDSGRGREASVRRLVDESPSLAQSGRILRAFFVPDADAPAGQRVAPYANRIGLTMDAMNSAERMLGRRAFREAEPIRTAELLRDLRARRTRLNERSGAEPDKVPVAIASAIDAWLGALDSFSTEALRP
ncbi:MAG: hypothetical protein OEY03_14715, partial [Rhizobacter sp.]|nr:hypothetical protein [Rhizobacter sp.]